MKKIVLTSLFLGSIVYAQDGIFAGFEVGKTKVTVSAESFSVDSSNETSFAIKLGKENDEYRIYGKYLNCDIDGDTMHIASINYDKYINIEGFKPFIGGSLGYLNYSEDEEVEIDLSGLTYGFRLGVIKDFPDGLSVEIGYSYILASATDDVKYGYNKIELGIDDYNTLHLGLNYKF